MRKNKKINYLESIFPNSEHRRLHLIIVIGFILIVVVSIVMLQINIMSRLNSISNELDLKPNTEVTSNQTEKERIANILNQNSLENLPPSSAELKDIANKLNTQNKAQKTTDLERQRIADILNRK